MLVEDAKLLKYLSVSKRTALEIVPLYHLMSHLRKLNLVPQGTVNAKQKLFTEIFLPLW